MKKKIICIIFIMIILLAIGNVLHMRGILKNLSVFFRDYINYVNMDVEHQAHLFESIFGGLCTGVVTFGALLITILHENRKDRLFWEKEREKETENRLLSVRPFLNVEVNSVSSTRTEELNREKDFISCGQGNKYQYAHIVLSNNGCGKCLGIELEGRKCSVRQLGVDEKEELKIYFEGLESDEIESVMIFGYRDIFGNSYLQHFKCYLRSNLRKLDVEIGEPLLKRG